MNNIEKEGFKIIAQTKMPIALVEKDGYKRWMFISNDILHQSLILENKDAINRFIDICDKTHE